MDGLKYKLWRKWDWGEGGIEGGGSFEPCPICQNCLYTFRVLQLRVSRQKTRKEKIKRQLFDLRKKSKSFKCNKNKASEKLRIRLKELRRNESREREKEHFFTSSNWPFMLIQIDRPCFLQTRKRGNYFFVFYFKRHPPSLSLLFFVFVVVKMSKTLPYQKQVGERKKES